jgi:hypothetical protein
LYPIKYVDVLSQKKEKKRDLVHNAPSLKPDATGKDKLAPGKPDEATADLTRAAAVDAKICAADNLADPRGGGGAEDASSVTTGEKAAAAAAAPDSATDPEEDRARKPPKARTEDDDGGKAANAEVAGAETPGAEDVTGEAPSADAPSAEGSPWAER